MTEVLRYARYLSDDSARVYSYEDYCGECRRHIDRPYQRPSYPDDLQPLGSFADIRISYDRDLEFFQFCPWCGAELDDEWWKGRILQNQRVVDHYDHPGTHAGDTHIFEGNPEGHYLSSSDGQTVCWCNPEITADIMGCTVRHRAENRR